MEKCKYEMKEIPQNIRDFCQYIIQFEHGRGKIVTNLRLQKLLYFIQAHCFINRIDPCLPDEMEAWRYGPVMPEVYDRYRFFGSIGIVPKLDIDMNLFVTEPELRELVDYALIQCEEFSTQDLIDISHHQDPWLNAIAKGEKSPITQEVMKAYFLRDQSPE